eukprot:138272-Hanusia_phi.AAC.1
MSIPGNSETFIVCKKFRGISEEYKEELLKYTGERWPKDKDGDDLSIVPRSVIPTSWIEQFSNCARYFAELQGAVINRNLRLFRDFPKTEGRRVKLARTLIVKEWISRFRFDTIPTQCRIVPHKNLTGAGESNRIGRRGDKRRRDEGNLDSRRAKQEERAAVRDGDFELEGLERLDDPTQVKRPRKDSPMQAEASAPEQARYSDVARKLMEKMGYKVGEGLGRD